MDYSLFIMETVEMLLGKKETTPAAPRRSFPPPICSSSSLFRCFRVLTVLPSGKHQGTIFIVVLRSRGSFGKKDQCKRSHEAQNKGSHMAQESGHVGLVVLALRPPLLRLFRSYAFFLPKKMIPLNFHVIWTSFGSLKLKNIENRVFCQCRANSKK